MRPFFSYYGSKYVGAKHYGEPRQNLVIEPFAGSACYSTRWNVENVKLYDVSPDVCWLWDFLIHCSNADISEIPDTFESIEEFKNLPNPQRILCGFWVSKGREEPSSTISPWYWQYKNTTDCRVWGRAVKDRIIQQKPAISTWSIENLSWEKIPPTKAHWHIDPPYNNSAGSRYPHSDIDYIALGEWCKSLPGSVDVCENQGADWLPFQSLYEVVSSRGRRDGGRSKEVVWKKS